MLTILNQNYFICNWWFNFDCSTAEELYSPSDELAALHAALDEVACDVDNSYASPSVAEVKTMMYPYKKYAK